MDAAGRAGQIEKVLQDLVSDVDIAACALLTDDGMLLGSTLDASSESSIGEPTVAWFSRAAEVAAGLSLGGVREITIRGEGGHAMFVSAGRHRMLLAVTRPEATLALAVLNARHAALALSHLAEG